MTENKIETQYAFAKNLFIHLLIHLSNEYLWNIYQTLPITLNIVLCGIRLYFMEKAINIWFQRNNEEP